MRSISILSAGFLVTTVATAGFLSTVGPSRTVADPVALTASMNPQAAPATTLARTPAQTPARTPVNTLSPADALAPSDLRILHGFQIAPVPLNLEGRKPALVGLGSYIVNAQGGCNDCHTNPPYEEDGNPFEGEPEQINVAGYLAGGTDFGIAVSANITPHINGMPAGLTLEEFITLLRTGVEEDGDILQVMPWPIYGKMTDLDLTAVYEYLSAIPPIDTPEPG